MRCRWLRKDNCGSWVSIRRYDRNGFRQARLCACYGQSNDTPNNGISMIIDMVFGGGSLPWYSDEPPRPASGCQEASPPPQGGPRPATFVAERAGARGVVVSCAVRCHPSEHRPDAFLSRTLRERTRASARCPATTPLLSPESAQGCRPHRPPPRRTMGVLRASGRWVEFHNRICGDREARKTYRMRS